jgi:hypothetical protein
LLVQRSEVNCVFFFGRSQRKSESPTCVLVSFCYVITILESCAENLLTEFQYRLKFCSSCTLCVSTCSLSGHSSQNIYCSGESLVTRTCYIYGFVTWHFFTARSC